MKEVVISIVASYVCASLSKQMWKSAKKVAEDSLAKDQVFRAVGRIFKKNQPSQRETVVNSFGSWIRIGSIVVGAISLGFALDAILKII